MAKVTPTVPVRGAPLAYVNVPENLIHRGNGLDADTGALMRFACANSPPDLLADEESCPQEITDRLAISAAAVTHLFKCFMYVITSLLLSADLCAQTRTH